MNLCGHNGNGVFFTISVPFFITIGKKNWARATFSAALFENTFCIFRFIHFHLDITEKKLILNQLDIDFQSPKVLVQICS
jgi:hypothetical protein